MLAAHNMSGFDRFACLRMEWTTPEDPWIDTSELARRAGLPGALDALGTRWLGIPKDKEASKFTKGLSSVRRPSGNNNPNAIPAEVWRTYDDLTKRERGALHEVTAEDMRRVVPYCLSDVEILAHGWPDLEIWLDLEPEVERVDRIVNDRGVYFDRDLAEQLLVYDEVNADVVCADVGARLGMLASEVRVKAMSQKQFKEETGSVNAQKATVLTMDHPLAQARLALASIASGKLEAGLARVSDDNRLRDTLRYYGASTGRWSGRGMQLQNMPRPAKHFEDDWEKEFGKGEDAHPKIDDWICRLADKVSAGRHIATQDEIDLLVRASICAAPGKGLSVWDFSGVEARALAWVAKDEPAIAAFLSGKDTYKVAAAYVFGLPYEAVSKPQRQLGKILELACLAGDTLVLTKRGPKVITEVLDSDLLWDGEEWVAHEGLVYQGERKCVEIEAVYMTPDHEVFVGDGFVTADHIYQFGGVDLALAQGVVAEATGFLRIVSDPPPAPRAFGMKEAVYDIAKAGPRHRFAVCSARGMLIVHNCGYGQGGKKFAETAAKMGADLAAVGVNSFAAVRAWRKLHAPIVQFWQDCEEAFVEAIHGIGSYVGPFFFAPSEDGKDVAIFLPSGRPIVYCDVRISKRVIFNDETGEVKRVTNSICMPGLKGVEWLYGGLIVENIIQAMCRDLMADALARAEVSGLCPVMTVHDEIVIEQPWDALKDAHRELGQIMRTWPEWAKGFPGDAAGFMGRRYRK